MANVTYYIGAGYSANALPIVANYPERISTVVQILETTYKLGDKASVLGNEHTKYEVQKRFVEGLKWLARESNPKRHASVDTYAKNLFLTGDDRYDELKALVACYFLLEQFSWNDDEMIEKIINETMALYDLEEESDEDESDIINDIENKKDVRYDTFFASIINKSGGVPKLDDRIHIISWNYDVQFELALASFFPETPKEGLPKLIQANLSSETERHILDTDRFSLTRLNGVASFFSRENKGVKNLENWLPALDNRALMADVLQQIVQLYDLCTQPKPARTVEPSISFAWEDSQSAKHAKEDAMKVMAETEYLVIGGYSFPYFNRETDRDLFSEMQRLEGVYINDENPAAIQEKLISVMPALLREKPSRRIMVPIDKFTRDKIKPIPNTDQFFLPHEL